MLNGDDPIVGDGKWRWSKGDYTLVCVQLEENWRGAKKVNTIRENFPTCAQFQSLIVYAQTFQ